MSASTDDGSNAGRQVSKSKWSTCLMLVFMHIKMALCIHLIVYFQTKYQNKSCLSRHCHLIIETTSMILIILANRVTLDAYAFEVGGS